MIDVRDFRRAIFNNDFDPSNPGLRVLVAAAFAWRGLKTGQEKESALQMWNNYMTDGMRKGSVSELDELLKDAYHPIPQVEKLMSDPCVSDILVIMYEETWLAARTKEHATCEEIKENVKAYFKKHGEESLGAPFQKS
jgi:hypothetical protein